MAFILLTTAVSCLFIQSDAYHTIVFIIHGVAATYIAWRMLRPRPLTAMFIALYVLMYFPNPVAVMTGLVPKTSSEAASLLYPSNALLLVGIDLFILAAQYLRRTNLDANRIPPMRLNHLRVELCIVLCLGVCAIASAVLAAAMTAAGIDMFRISKHFIHGYGEHGRYYMLMSYAFLTLPLAVFLIGLKPPGLQLPYLISVGALLTFHFMVLRVRSPFVAVLFAYFVATVVRQTLITLGPRPPKGGLSRLVKLGLAFGPVTIIFVGIGVKYMRQSYMTDDYRLTAERIEELSVHTFAGGDLGFAYFLRRAIETFPSRHSYLNGQSYYRLLFTPIPRTLWPGKPENTQRVFAAALSSDFRKSNTTIPAGIVGDLYINFGPIGVVGMLVWGFIFAQERYRGLTSLIVLSGSPWWMFHIVRGGLTVPLAFLVTMYIVSVILKRIIKPGVLTWARRYPMAGAGVFDGSASGMMRGGR